VLLRRTGFLIFRYSRLQAALEYPGMPAVSLSATREERLDCGRAILSEHSGSYLDSMVEALIREYVETRANCSALGVVGAVDESPNARMDHRPGAHAARFDRDVKRSAREPVIPARARRFTQNDDFGVRRRIAVAYRAIPGTSKNAAAMHQDRADRHFTGRRRRTAFLERLPHEFNVPVHPEPENSTLPQEYFYIEPAAKAHIPHPSEQIRTRNRFSGIEANRGILEIEKQEVTFR
jgi:hypothetical protein